MSIGSSYYDLHFDHTYVGDTWTLWAINRTSPNPTTLASASGSPKGLHLKTGQTVDMSGTLSQQINDGDSITIQLGTDEQ